MEALATRSFGIPTIQEAYELATIRGYLPLRADTRWLSEEPKWLMNLQQPDGFVALEAALGHEIPEVVKQLWRLPDLVRLLDSWRWQDYLDNPLAIIQWDGKPNLVICTHPHSGGLGAVILDKTDDPKLSWGFAEDDEPFEWREVTMSQHVYCSVEQGPELQRFGERAEPLSGPQSPGTDADIP